MRDYLLEPEEYSMPICPICGEECEEFYFNRDGNICGCDNCISVKNAVEYEEEERESAREAYADHLYEMQRDLEYERGIDV